MKSRGWYTIGHTEKTPYVFSRCREWKHPRFPLSTSVSVRGSSPTHSRHGRVVSLTAQSDLHTHVTVGERPSPPSPTHTLTSRSGSVPRRPVRPTHSCHGRVVSLAVQSDSKSLRGPPRSRGLGLPTLPPVSLNCK